jgi:hypothetical protein
MQVLNILLFINLLFFYYFITNIQVYNVFCQVKDYPVFTTEQGITFYVQRIVYQNKTMPITYDDLMTIDDYNNVRCHYTSWYFDELQLGHVLE